MPTKIVWWVSGIAISFFILGILLSTCIEDWPLITLKSEADILNAITSIISIVVTLIIAYWVTIVLEKQNTNDRTEKDIIIKHIEHLYLIIEEIREKVRTGNINYSLAASNVKRIYVNTATIQLCLTKNSISIIENHELLIQNELSIVKNLLTNTVPGDINLTVSNGIITISENRQILIDAQLDKLRNEIFQFELAINKA